MATPKQTATSENKALIGARMKRAAISAGYGTTTAMGDAMGVDQGTISKWWRGLQTPKVDQMAVYAQMVGKPRKWFYSDNEEEVEDALADLLIQIVDQVMDGRDLAEAFSQVTSSDESLSRRQRQRLVDGTPAVRRYVRQKVGDQVADLPPRERKEFADHLIAEVRHPEEG